MTIAPVLRGYIIITVDVDNFTIGKRGEGGGGGGGGVLLNGSVLVSANWKL